MALYSKLTGRFPEKSRQVLAIRWESSSQSWKSSANSLINTYQKKSAVYLQSNQKKTADYVKFKVKNAVSWYEEFSGLRQLKEMQARVFLATELLKEAQDKRREVKEPLSQAQKRLQNFQPELRNTPRDDDRYIQLVNEEHQLMKEIKYLQLKLQESENDERDAFEQLSTSLRISHEAERVQAEKTKYFSIIASILGTIIGVFGSSINNSFRMKELKALVRESANPTQMESLMSVRDALSGKVADLRNVYLRLDAKVAESQALEQNLMRICEQMQNVVVLNERLSNLQRKSVESSLHVDNTSLGDSLRNSSSLNNSGKGDSGIVGENACLAGENVYPHHVRDVTSDRRDINKKFILPIGALVMLFVFVNEMLH